MARRQHAAYDPADEMTEGAGGMTAFLTWRDDLLMGIDALDALIAHVRGHFEREEAFLRAIGYPNYFDHKRGHTMQMAEFIDLRRRLADETTRYVDPDTALGIRNWFFNHVIAEDREYAAYFFRVCRGRIPEATSEGSA